MVKAKKKKKRGKYKPVKVNDSFLNIMQASVKDANNKSAPNKPYNFSLRLIQKSIQVAACNGVTVTFFNTDIG